MSKVICSVIAFGMLLLGCQQHATDKQNYENSQRASVSYVGGKTCASCHQEQYDLWKGSHHDLAMQPADANTVLGNFDNSSFRYSGVTSKFFRRDGKFFVHTDGPDGKLNDYEIKYSFGVYPLQQYLIPFPDGRLQALSIAWDSRPRADGGQRWFHLYSNERVTHKDVLHWTRLQQNWNFMCVECHSTNVKKNYDPATRQFRTTFSEIDVSCEACHGPGANHVTWAQRPRFLRYLLDEDMGLAIMFNEHRGVSWNINPETGTAKRRVPRESAVEIEMCARCHARRSTLSADYRHGTPLMDTHLPALLSEGLYFADGQIQDEVYVYGSFLQSRMHAKGVRCSDCHEPHSTKVRAAGNALCITCHDASDAKAGAHINTSGLKRKDYDSPAHHFHKPGRAGAQCVDCHAPARNYMVVDPRRDHSFRIPRPDLSIAIGTPNACNHCHDKQTPKWAADAVARWYGPQRRQEHHYGEALFAGRYGKPGAVAGLVALADDGTQPAIVRATALDLLGQYPGRSALATLQRGLKDSDPLVRRAAVVGQELLPAAQRAAALVPMLDDPVRAVRIEAARLLAPAARSLPADRKERFNRALAEFEAVQQENADRPEAHANLGNLYIARGEAARAEAAYRKAIVLNSRFVPAYVNLSDVYRAGGRDAESEQMLRQGLRAVPNSAALHEALGLSMVRQGNKGGALAEFAAASRATPDSPRHSYVYAVALDGAGRRAEAIRVLKTVVKNRGDRDALLALASFSLQSGDRAGAEAAIRALASINPDDPALGSVAGRP